MPNQTNKLFDWETGAEESLDENNLPIAKEDPTKDYTVEDYMEAAQHNSTFIRIGSKIFGQRD